MGACAGCAHGSCRLQCLEGRPLARDCGMTITMACASCRFPNAPEAKFCRQCGAPLAANAAPPQAGIACPGCGQPVADGLKFCRTCGHQIAVPGQTAQSAAAPAAQAAAATPAPVHTPPPSRPRPVYASSRPQAPARRRKVWPWAVGGGLLAAVAWFKITCPCMHLSLASATPVFMKRQLNWSRPLIILIIKKQ